MWILNRQLIFNMTIEPQLPLKVQSIMGYEVDGTISFQSERGNKR